MSTSRLQRAFAAIELLIDQPNGLPLQSIADNLTMPKSGTHRLLTELAELGYVRQDEERGHYHLTTKVIALGYRHLEAIGVADIAQPIIDKLAATTGELVRLAAVDGDTLVFMLLAQGRRSGLRYEPDNGQPCPLFCTATGHAFLSCFDDEIALAWIARQGLDVLTGYGPNAPRSPEAILDCVRAARERGYGFVSESSAPGTTAIAAPVFYGESRIPVGALSVAGPLVHLDAERLHNFADDLLAATQELSHISPASPHLQQAKRRSEAVMG